jgi:hypothetical protein
MEGTNSVFFVVDMNHENQTASLLPSGDEGSSTRIALGNTVPPQSSERCERLRFSAMVPTRTAITVSPLPPVPMVVV